MGIVRDIITPILPVVLGIAIGAGGSQMWGWYRYTAAINAELSMRGERDKLVADLATEKLHRAQAQTDARKARQNVYAQDKNAAAWASERVPSAIDQQLLDVARAAVEASRGAEPDDLP